MKEKRKSHKNIRKIFKKVKKRLDIPIKIW